MRDERFEQVAILSMATGIPPSELMQLELWQFEVMADVAKQAGKLK